MSEREKMYQLLDMVPDNKISYIIGYIQGLTIEGGDEPNTETIKAMQELSNKQGEVYEDTEALFESWDKL